MKLDGKQMEIAAETGSPDPVKPVVADAEMPLSDEQAEGITGGITGNLSSLNHCWDPKGKCNKNPDKRNGLHAWTPYKDVYICINCDKWAYLSEI